MNKIAHVSDDHFFDFPENEFHSRVNQVKKFDIMLFPTQKEQKMIERLSKEASI
jgi:hypothetical protein